MKRIGNMMGLMSRVFVSVSLFTMCIFILIGFIGIIQNKVQGSSISSMKGTAVAISSHFFTDMLAMEVPHMKGMKDDSSLSSKNVLSFLVHFLTNVDPKNPKSFLAGEIPGLQGESSNLLYAGKTMTPADYPSDFTPPANVFQPNQSTDTNQKPREKETDPNTVKPIVDNEKDQAAIDSPRKTAVFIYHSHNRESYLPELEGVTKPDLAYDSKVNVALVGKRLKEKLEGRGIPTQHSETDYPTAVKDFKFPMSYAYSNATVKEAMAAHPELMMVFDIHRDSLARNRTTVKLNGQDYAQVFFVVGKRNPNWQLNSDFANLMHTKLEMKHSGISKGVFAKSSHGNAEYNQSLFGNSILLEIGGPENTLQEIYRTVDILADVIEEIYRSSEKVSAPPA